MGFGEKLRHELRELRDVSLYFGTWLALLITVKHLILAEYHIDFSGYARILVGTLVLAKVVMVLEHVNLGSWTKRAPAWQEIVVRTALYTAGVFVVLLVEKLVDELRVGAGGVAAALARALQATNFNQAMANTLAVSCSLLVYNFLAVLKRYLQPDGLAGVLRRPPPRDLPTEVPGSGGRADPGAPATSKH